MRTLLISISLLNRTDFLIVLLENTLLIRSIDEGIHPRWRTWYTSVQAATHLVGFDIHFLYLKHCLAIRFAIIIEFVVSHR